MPSQQALQSNSISKSRARESPSQEEFSGGESLTDRAFVSPRIVDLIVANSLRPIHGLVEHHQLHLLLLNKVVSCRVHVDVLLLRVFEVLAAHGHVLVLVLDHVGALAILEVTLLLVGFDGDVSVDAVEVFLLLCKHCVRKKRVGSRSATFC